MKKEIIKRNTVVFTENVLIDKMILSAEKYLNSLNSVYKYGNIICKSKSGLKTLEDVEKAIKKEANFPNVFRSAELLGIDSQYKFIKDFYTELSEFSPDDFEFSKDEDKYFLGEISGRITEQFTTRLSDSANNDLEKIQDTISVLNSLTDKYPNSIRINRNTMRPFVNIAALHSDDKSIELRELRRKK